MKATHDTNNMCRCQQCQQKKIVMLPAMKLQCTFAHQLTVA